VKTEKKPTNYIVVLDLSDRILLPETMKRLLFIEKYFKAFEENSRRNGFNL
jgi:hypothetical protein